MNNHRKVAGFWVRLHPAAQLPAESLKQLLSGEIAVLEFKCRVELEAYDENYRSMTWEPGEDDEIGPF